MGEAYALSGVDGRCRDPVGYGDPVGGDQFGGGPFGGGPFVHCAPFGPGAPFGYGSYGGEEDMSDEHSEEGHWGVGGRWRGDMSGVMGRRGRGGGGIGVRRAVVGGSGGMRGPGGPSRYRGRHSLRRRDSFTRAIEELSDLCERTYGPY